MEIMQFNNDNKDRVYNWVRCTTSPIHIDGEPALKILTRRGVITARLSDYIIKDWNGEYSVYSEEVFMESYNRYEQYIKEF